jgi:hypothetical protein
MARLRFLGALATAALLAGPVQPLRGQGGFDHDYRAYATLLRTHLRDGRVDYARLKAGRQGLDAVVRAFGDVSDHEVQTWSRPQQMAFWINAYNAFTLRAIVDHYPIEGSRFSLHPRNSIRQIDGAWTTLTWTAAGRTVTLDDIEHRILRPTFREPLVHFAVNCASVSCPPLAPEPYRAATLDAELHAAARRFLASPLGVTLRGARLSVSSILKWYGDDFVERYGRGGPRAASPVDRAILGVVATFGPTEARLVAEGGTATVAFLAYDWSLNDLSTR